MKSPNHVMIADGLWCIKLIITLQIHIQYVVTTNSVTTVQDCHYINS